MDVIVEFITSLGSFFASIFEGIGTVSGLLVDAGSKIGQYTSFLPSSLSAAITGMVSLIIGLAVVRWCT